MKRDLPEILIDPHDRTADVPAGYCDKYMRRNNRLHHATRGECADIINGKWCFISQTEVHQVTGDDKHADNHVLVRSLANLYSYGWLPQVQYTVTSTSFSHHDIRIDVWRTKPEPVMRHKRSGTIVWPHSTHPDLVWNCEGYQAYPWAGLGMTMVHGNQIHCEIRENKPFYITDEQRDDADIRMHLNTNRTSAASH